MEEKKSRKYIDRDKLKKKKKYCFQTVFGAFPKHEYFIKFTDLLEAPAADVQEVKHGKDICETVLNHHCEFKCSVCGNWIGTVEGGTLDGAIEFNFCPACGAIMDGKEE